MFLNSALVAQEDTHSLVLILTQSQTSRSRECHVVCNRQRTVRDERETHHINLAFVVKFVVDTQSCQLLHKCQNLQGHNEGHPVLGNALT